MSTVGDTRHAHSGTAAAATAASFPQACAEPTQEDDGSDEVSTGLYAALSKRRSELASRSDMIQRERKLLAALGEGWPAYERAQAQLWDHWYSEYGEDAKDALVEAEGKAGKLMDLIEEYPDWVEPANRLATLMYMDENFEESANLCLRILRTKPWHFGAGSGIVMCYAKLGNAVKANTWAREAMPPAATKEREAWVKTMLEALDEKLAEVSDMSE